jgi:predicted nucleotidyltransferase
MSIYENNILQILQKHISSLTMVYIFGSVASNTHSKNSDIDIAFLSLDNINNVTRWDIQQTLAVVLKKDIDLVDLSQCSEVFKVQVISTGNCIFNIDKTNFEDNTYYKYIDLNELKSDIVNDIYLSGNVYG